MKTKILQLVIGLSCLLTNMSDGYCAEMSNFGIKGYNLGSVPNSSDSCKEESANGVLIKTCKGRTTIFDVPFFVESFYSENKLILAGFGLDKSNQSKFTEEEPFPPLTNIDYSSLLNNVVIKINDSFGEPQKKQEKKSMYDEIVNGIKSVNFNETCRTNNPVATLSCINRGVAGQKYSVGKIRQQCGSCVVFINEFSWVSDGVKVNVRSMMPERKSAPHDLYKLLISYENIEDVKIFRENAKQQIRNDQSGTQRRIQELKSQNEMIEKQNAQKKMSDF